MSEQGIVAKLREILFLEAFWDTVHFFEKRNFLENNEDRILDGEHPEPVR